MSFSEWLRAPWPWWISGPLIGLIVPLLLILGNKSFGISSSLRHICAACLPGNIPFFKYDWKKESWNLFFVAGIVAGAVICSLWSNNPDPVSLNPALVDDLHQHGIKDVKGLLPYELFNWNNLFSLQGFLLIVAGGFLVGFGTRYAGGCTSGHSIMGLSTLQWPSLVATICFMIGGFIAANLFIPHILNL
jgi:uncharacterized membrane protein YedE/YeeE